jgi:protocatechuate 3,4-dioxygenase, alpha subunit
MSLIPSGSQTVGPFFNFGLTTNPNLGILARDGVEGERIRLEFRATDGDGAPTPGDSMIELWQADARGRYGEADANFCGFGRLETNANGECVFETVKPGCVPGNDGGMQAPHINIVFFARGLLLHLHTRVYFAGDPANAADPVLQMVPESRRSTLLAQPVTDRPGAWRMEIHLQGEAETVFFDV